MIKIKFNVDKKKEGDLNEKVTMSVETNEIENSSDTALIESIIQWSAEHLEYLQKKISQWNDVLNQPR